MRSVVKIKLMILISYDIFGTFANIFQWNDQRDQSTSKSEIVINKEEASEKIVTNNGNDDYEASRKKTVNSTSWMHNFVA